MARGQASTETIIILAIIIGIITILFVTLLGIGTTMTSTYDSGITRVFVDNLADTAEQIWWQGDGARGRVYVQIPDTITNITLNGSSIVLSKHGNQTAHVRVLPFNITGNLSADRSGYWVGVERAGNTIHIRPI